MSRDIPALLALLVLCALIGLSVVHKSISESENNGDSVTVDVLPRLEQGALSGLQPIRLSRPKVPVKKPEKHTIVDRPTLRGENPLASATHQKPLNDHKKNENGVNMEQVLDVSHQQKESAHVQHKSRCPSSFRYNFRNFDMLGVWTPPKQKPGDVNPFQNPGRGSFSPIGPVLVPSRRLSRTLGAHKYGGFTADMGWILMTTRYALTPDAWEGREPEALDRDGKSYRLVEFPAYWGHGCANDAQASQGDAGDWTCFFLPIVDNTDELLPGVERVSYIQETDLDRGYAKMKQVFTTGFKEASHRNRVIQQIADIPKGEDGQEYANDLQSMRYVFQWLFRLQPHVRSMVDDVKQPILKAIQEVTTTGDYAGLHIRWGDKVGRKSGPREGNFVPVSKYINLFFCYYEKQKRPAPKVIFIATDDYNAVREARELLGPEYTVVTTTKEHVDGFSIDEYRTRTNAQKFQEALNLWADMELLSAADIFMGTFESNIGKTVHLMRFGKDPLTSLSMTGNQCHSSEELTWKYRSNNFWMCAS